MTTSRPTPPPWKAYNQEVYWTINATDNRGGPWLVAQVNRSGDARLIAAAPELLDVCRRRQSTRPKGGNHNDLYGRGSGGKMVPVYEIE